MGVGRDGRRGVFEAADAAQRRITAVVVDQVAKRATGRWLADAGVEVAAADKCLGTHPGRVRVRRRRRVRGTEGGKRLESKSAANELAELFERLRCKGRGEWERVGVKVAADNEGLLMISRE